MTRAEKRALEVYPIESYEMYDDMYRQRGAYVKGYEKGYQEAQAHTIDKACQWLIGEFSQKQDRDGHPNIESRSCVSVEELIQDFRKAMEEELWERCIVKELG